MLYVYRISLGFIGGFNIVNHSEIAIPVIIIGLLLCFVEENE